MEPLKLLVTRGNAINSKKFFFFRYLAHGHHPDGDEIFFVFLNAMFILKSHNLQTHNVGAALPKQLLFFFFFFPHKYFFSWPCFFLYNKLLWKG